MPTAWRQGDLIAPDDAVALGLIESTQRNTHRVIVISHSCDIASADSVEPRVETLIGVVVQEAAATSRNGHSIRTLHLHAEASQTTEWIQYGILDRRDVPKPDLLSCEPWTEHRHPGDQRALLRRWLAQRYSRSEFPDAFINWLKESGVGDGFEKLGKRYSAALVGIYFDLDDDSERTKPNEPYSLGIVLVYDSGRTEHATEAETARVTLEALFKRRCLASGRWQWIELTYCDAVSEDVFNLRAARLYRRWRFEHRSLGGEPIDTAE